MSADRQNERVCHKGIVVAYRRDVAWKQAPDVTQSQRGCADTRHIG
jgi:hypothetical protein